MQTSLTRRRAELPGGLRARALANIAPWLPALPALLFLLVFFLLPVGQILQRSLVASGGALSDRAFVQIAHNGVYAKVLWITLEVSFLTALLSVLLGYPLAYWLSRLTDRRRERWMLWVLLPFWTSFLVKTYAWILLLTRAGVLSKLAVMSGITQHSFALVPSMAGVLIGMVQSMIPLAVMTMLPVMRTIDERLDQAAQTMGAQRGMSFFTIFLPLSAPGVAAAALLIFITSLGFFIVPALLGTPRETMIAQLVISAVLELFDMHLAAALSVFVLAASIVIFIAYDRVVGLSSLAGQAGTRKRGSLLRGTGGRLAYAFGRMGDLLARARPAGDPRGPRASGPLGVYACVLLFCMVAPVLSVVPYAFTRADFVAFPPTLFSMRWFVDFLHSPVWRAAVMRSFEVGFGTALLASCLGFGATLAMTRLSQRTTRGLFALMVAPLIVPRIVIAVGLLYLLSALRLVGTNAGLIIGHTVLAIPYVVVTLAAGFQRFDWRLDDAAKLMGASIWRRIATVMFPLMRASAIAGFLFAFLVSFDDLTIAIFVSGGVNTTLPKLMWDNIQLAITPTLSAVATTLLAGIVVVVGTYAWMRRGDG
jgi:putative spermidine/putrescine transport system permease protein